MKLAIKAPISNNKLPTIKRIIVILGVFGLRANINIADKNVKTENAMINVLSRIIKSLLDSLLYMKIIIKISKKGILTYSYLYKIYTPVQVSAFLIIKPH